MGIAPSATWGDGTTHARGSGGPGQAEALGLARRHLQKCGNVPGQREDDRPACMVKRLAAKERKLPQQPIREPPANQAHRLIEQAGKNESGLKPPPPNLTPIKHSQPVQFTH
eukprot:scaffold284944_cov18-Tisochrysis_lutea.AAC.1